MDYNKIPEYDFSDFILDDEFAGRALDPENASFFISQLKEQFPGKKEEIEKALLVLRSLQNKKIVVPYRKKIDLFEKIINNRIRKIRFLRVAAVFLLLAGLGILTLLFPGKKAGIEEFAAGTAVDFSASRLILSDGSEVNIASDQAAISYSADGSSVGIDDTTRIRQDVGSEAFNQIIVPYGKNLNLTLADGTKVWLHSGSRLVYPPVFTGKSREVFLEGEGYFEVTPDQEQPFYVKTSRFRTRVYGTRFDVRAYEKEQLFSTILLEGKVSLAPVKGLKAKEITLTPNQQGNLRNDGSGFDVEEVENTDNYIAWIYGHLNFDHEELGKLLERVQRYYNLPVQLRSAFPTVRISGKLDLKEDPERVLRGIATIAKLKLTKQGEGFLLSD
jgi:ferric-dicitrate binding protein FerR (iron transport regulator)